jgi:hypothetical protein
MATPTTLQLDYRCVICGQGASDGLLCNIHREQGEFFNYHLKKLAKHELIQVTKLSIEPYNAVTGKGFQREPVNEQKIQKIILNFNELALGELCVSRRARQNILIDGGHRWTALMRMGFAEAPCEVYEGLTYEQEVMIFVIRNKDRTAVRQGLLFNDNVQAGIQPYVAADKILREYGYRVGDPQFGKGVKPNLLNCPTTVEKVFAMKKLALTLETMRQTWRDDPQANRAEAVLGIATFLTVHPQIKPEEIAEHFQKHGFGAAELASAAKSKAVGSMERRLWVHYFDALSERWNFRRTQKRVGKLDIPKRAPGLWMGK